jgi:hypothetical protein
MMENHLARAHAMIEATRKFYAQLEPSQKKVFDELPMLVGAGGMGPHVMVKAHFPHGGMPPMAPHS